MVVAMFRAAHADMSCVKRLALGLICLIIDGFPYKLWGGVFTIRLQYIEINMTSEKYFRLIAMRSPIVRVCGTSSPEMGRKSGRVPVEVQTIGCPS